MKKLLLMGTFVSLTMLSACSKSDTNPKTTLPATVTINSAAYTTVVIGKQTWTSQNYNGADTTIFNGAKFYTITQAEAISLPAGWRLPTLTDFNNLLIATGGTIDPYAGQVNNGKALSLMAKSGWLAGSGTDSLGFNAMPVGYVLSDPFAYEEYQIETDFWSTSIAGGDNPVLLKIQHIDGTPAYTPTVQIGTFAISYASIRFVKDN